MTELVNLGADVEWPDGRAAQVMRETSAARRYGRLGELMEWLASVQAVAPPHDLARARIVIFGGEPCSPEIAGLAEASVRIVSPAAGDSADQSLAAGAAIADDEVESGADLFVVAVPEPATSAAAPAASSVLVAASVLIAVLTNTEPVKVMDRGIGHAPEAWMGQAIAIRDGRRRAFPLGAEPDGLLGLAGGGELASATGFLLRSAARRTPVVLDGLGAAAAALVGHSAQPRAARWWQSADRCGNPAQDLALAKLAQQPLLNLGIGAADGTAGALALLTLRAAVRAVAPDAWGET